MVRRTTSLRTALFVAVFAACPPLASHAMAQEISWSPASIAFPGAALGFAEYRYLNVQNPGGAFLVLSSPQLGTAEFEVGSFPVSIAPGTSTNLPILYKRLALGVARDTLRLATNVPGTPQIAVPLSGSALPPYPVPTWTDSLDFGTDVVGRDSHRIILLGNDGAEPYAVTAASPPSAEFFVTTPLPVTVFPGMNRLLDVRYGRLEAGTAEGTLELSTNIESMPILEVSLVGTAELPMPAGILTPGPLDFGTLVVGGTAEVSALLLSVGNVPLQVSSITVSSPDVTVLKTVPFTLQPGNGAAIDFRLHATAPGPFSAVVQVRTNATPDSILSLTLIADVKPPPVVSVDPASFAPVELAFGQTTAVPFSVLNLGEDWPLSGAVWVQVDSALAAPGDPLPAVGLPQVRFDGEGHLWDVAADGSIATGDSAAFAGGVDWFAFPAQTTALLRDGGRTIQLGPATIGPRDFTRSVHVSLDGAWVRYVDTVRNRTNAPQTTRILVNSRLHVPVAPIGRTSSGDGIFEPQDDWTVVADDFGPAIGHVFAGPGGQRPVATSFGPGLLSVNYDYDLVLGPGATGSILHYALQAPTLAEAMQRAELLRVPDAAALVGIGAVERSRIVNFALPQAIRTNHSSFAIGPLGSQAFALAYHAGAVDHEQRVYGTLRVASNDPVTPLVVVPLELRLLGDLPEVIGVEPGGALALVARFVPNPMARRGVRLAYALPTTGDARFELYDVRGRRIAARTLTAAPAGPGTLDWSAGTDLALAPGMYWTRLTHGGTSVITKGVVLR